ncbi:hypothetical protein BJV78DRAFT_1176211 [Lactifluus subvellereus]|nr:hypothetical protein BJV78DRAFT_1176211 [Lactifluus subvellereus]
MFLGTRGCYRAVYLHFLRQPLSPHPPCGTSPSPEPESVQTPGPGTSATGTGGGEPPPWDV